MSSLRSVAEEPTKRLSSFASPLPMLVGGLSVSSEYQYIAGLSSGREVQNQKNQPLRQEGTFAPAPVSSTCHQSIGGESIALLFSRLCSLLLTDHQQHPTSSSPASSCFLPDPTHPRYRYQKHESPVFAYAIHSAGG